MIMDILILIIIVLLIISLEIDYIKENIDSKEKEYKNLETLEEILKVESIISDSNYLAYEKNNVTYKNKIEIKNIDNLKKINNLNNVKIKKEIININHKECKTNTYTRGVVYENKFEILEVSFCE